MKTKKEENQSILQNKTRFKARQH